MQRAVLMIPGETWFLLYFKAYNWILPPEGMDQARAQKALDKVQ